MEKNQQQLLESMPDGIVVADAGGRIEFVSRQALKMSGYSRKELIGRNIDMLVPTGNRAVHRGHRTSYFAKPSPRAMGSGLNIRLRRKDGTEFPADIALSPLETADGWRVIAAVRDVSDRTRIEHDLRDAEERVRLMVDGVVDYAILQLDSSGRVASWNAGAQRIKGYRARDIVGRHFSVFYTPEDIKRRKPQLSLATARRLGRFEEEGERVRKNGSRFWANVVITRLLDSAGKVRGFTKVTRDITERKRNQDHAEALLEITQATLQGQSSEQVMLLLIKRARSLVGASQGLALVPRADNKTMTVSHADGPHAEKLKGKTYPIDKPSAGRAIVAPLEAADHFFGAVALSNPKGNTPFSANDVATVRLFATQAAAALEYSRLRTELQRLAVMEDRERIARELHDGAIQSLFAVGMGLQGLAARAADGEVQQRIETSVVQIDGVIGDLRNYIFGLRPDILSDRHLHQALTGIAKDFQKRTGVTTVIDIDAGVAARLGSHAGELIQLATESLSNVARHAEAKTCRVSLASNHAGAVLEVDDDGKGFDPAKRRGRGQGLRNLRERAGKLGGLLEITSSAGHGTSVRVTIPLSL